MRTSLVIVVLFCLPKPAFAGAWTQDRGAVWVKVAGLYQFADEFYASSQAVLPDGTPVNEGDRRPYDDNGNSKQYVIWMEGEYGVTDRLTLGLQAQWKDLRYEDDFSKSRSFGWGDTWVVGRYALLTGSQRVSVRTAVKLPTGRFSTEVGQIPIGENQPDLDMGLQWGTSLGRALSWIGVEGLYRFRFEDESREYKPGNEVFARLEAGWGFTKWFGVKANWVSQRGDETSLNFFAPGTELNRNFDQVELYAMFDTPWVFVEAGVSHVIASPSWPAAPLWSLGVSRKFRLIS